MVESVGSTPLVKLFCDRCEARHEVFAAVLVEVVLDLVIELSGHRPAVRRVQTPTVPAHVMKLQTAAMGTVKGGPQEANCDPPEPIDLDGRAPEISVDHPTVDLADIVERDALGEFGERTFCASRRIAKQETFMGAAVAPGPLLPKADDTVAATHRAQSGLLSVALHPMGFADASTVDVTRRSLPTAFDRAWRLVLSRPSSTWCW